MASDFDEYMKKCNSIAITLIVLSMLAHSCGTAFAESSEPFPDEEWNRTYSVGAVDDTHWMEQTSDGGYVIIGSVDHFSHGNALIKEYIIVKTDSKGNQQWSGKFREEDEDRAGYQMQTYIMQTSDRGYLIAGSTENFKTGSLNIWVRKLDAEGIEQWKKDFREDRPSRQFFGGNNITDCYNDANMSVRETPDGGFLILGKTNHCQNCTIEIERTMDIWLIKTDQKGNEKWAWIRTRSQVDHAGPGLQTSDGGFVMMGTSSYLNASVWYEEIQIGPEWNTDIWLMKMDANGNEQWRKSNRVKSLAWEASLSKTQDGGYVYSAIVEERPENDYENSDSFSVKFVKLDSNGNIEWQKRDEGYSIKPTTDGGYITVRGFQLVKIGGVKPEPLQSLILLGTTIVTPTQTMRAGSNETKIVTPLQKVAGFEAALAITTLLLVIIIRRNRRK